MKKTIKVTATLEWIKTQILKLKDKKAAIPGIYDKQYYEGKIMGYLYVEAYIVEQSKGFKNVNRRA